eukprot:6188458-Pleurochrysis_carterae.AAC.1
MCYGRGRLSVPLDGRARRRSCRWMAVHADGLATHGHAAALRHGPCSYGGAVWLRCNYLNIDVDAARGRRRSLRTTAPPPAIRPIYGSIAYIGRVRAA